MQIFVRTTGERRFNYHREIADYKILYDRQHLNQSKYIDDLLFLSSLDDDILLLEDDLQLCKNFLQRLESAINEFPNMIITFFRKPWYARTTPRVITDLNFAYTQCVYYPKGSLNQFVKDMVLDTNIGYDEIQDLAMKKNNIPFVDYRPHLVQHIGNKSLITPNAPQRRSVVFIDDLN